MPNGCFYNSILIKEPLRINYVHVDLFSDLIFLPVDYQILYYLLHGSITDPLFPRSINPFRTRCSHKREPRETFVGGDITDDKVLIDGAVFNTAVAVIRPTTARNVQISKSPSVKKAAFHLRTRQCVLRLNRVGHNQERRVE